MKPAPAVFVDTSAWIGMAMTKDPHHPRAVATWTDLQGARLVTSIPVVTETFTFLDRSAPRTVAMAWRDQITAMRRLQIVECTHADLTKSWIWFERSDLHRLSSVDAISFTLMRRLRIPRAFAFDQHFAQAGFQVLG
jgi:uncharacterized protein